MTTVENIYEILARQTEMICTASPIERPANLVKGSA
jgi:hypothetical protein